jgi:hypothetical protein
MYVCQDSVVGTAGRYGLDGLGIKSRCGRDFSHLARLTPKPTKRPAQTITDLFLWDKAAGGGGGVALTNHPILNK